MLSGKTQKEIRRISYGTSLLQTRRTTSDACEEYGKILKVFEGTIYTLMHLKSSTTKKILKNLVL